jgi:hypothetical protein
MLITALRVYDRFYGDMFTVECPKGSGRPMTLNQIAIELGRRLIALFVPGEDGRRPCFGPSELLQRDEHFKDYLLFHEFFHGDTGEGLGASHQTGWTGLVAKLIEQQAMDRGAANARLGRREPAAGKVSADGAESSADAPATTPSIP